MKKYLLLIISVLVLVGCEKKEDRIIGYDQIELDPFIIAHYSDDARQIYFDALFHDSTNADYNNPTLDTAEITKVLKIIQAVYDNPSPERDTVFDLYQIHGYYCYSFNSLYMEVNTALPAIENLSSNIIPTGDAALDNLLNTYHFDSVKTFYSYPDFPWLTIYTPDEYNMIPITKSFATLAPVLQTDFNRGCIGDGNNITLIRDDHAATITFSIGWGDCPAGCIYHKYWEFRVSNGKAAFIRTY